MQDLEFNWYLFTVPVAILLLAIAIISVFKLKNNRALAEKICYFMLTFLLIYKTFHYVLYCTVLGYSHTWSQQIPCEISQVSFFLFPIAYLSQSKAIKDAGRFLGFFAGFVQLIAIAVAPNSFVNSGTLTVFSFIETIVMHYILFYCALVSITCIEKLEFKNIWKVYLGVLLTVLWGVLAGRTWRFGTDAGYPNSPANIGFVERCVLPQPIIDAWPWLGQGHNFIAVYLVAFFAFTAGVYLISAAAFKNKPQQQVSYYGMGWVGMRKFMKSHDVALKYDDIPFEESKTN